MQTLTRMDSTFIWDHCHITKMDENINWMKPTHVLSIFSLNLKHNPLPHTGQGEGGTLYTMYTPT